MTYMDVSLAKLKEFEGSIPWIYLDTVGLATVGVGHMLPNATAACALPFRYVNGSLASDADITSAYNSVKAKPAGKPAAFYHPTSSVTLAQADIDSLLRSVNVANDATLTKFIPAYDSYPDKGKIGMLDMIYNLGWDRLVKEYPHFMAAARVGNFPLMAAQCGRNVSDTAFAARNAWTKQMFLEAA